MKKNRMLRMASALLILTLLTTSVIGGTFAKYVSTGSVSDTARVAKWGVEIKTSGTLYSDAYAKAAEGAGSNLPAAWDTTTINNKTVTVASAESAKDNIVAPGTKSYENGLSFAISGTPEVAVKVSANIVAEDIFLAAGSYGVLVPATVSDKESLKKVIDANSDGVYSLTTGSATTSYNKVENADSYADDTDYFILTNKIEVAADYFPVVYTLTGTTKNESASDSKKAVGIADKLASVIKNDATKTETKGANNTVYKVEYSKTNLNADFAANTDLAANGPKFGDEKLTWEWPFEDTVEANKDTTNAKDTLLGDMIAARNDTAEEYIVVAVDGNNVAALTYAADDDYTVKKGDTVVANLYTQFDITLTVEQVD